MARLATGRWLIALLLGAAPPPEAAPSLELLLHLAEFSDADGRPVDPASIAAMMDAPALPDAEAAGSPAAAATAPRDVPAGKREEPAEADDERD